MKLLGMLLDAKSMVARFLLIKYTKMGKTYTKLPLKYQMAIYYTKWPTDISNCHKIHQHLSLQDTLKCTQIWIFGFENIPSGNLA
jgi:hypothetical protein